MTVNTAKKRRIDALAALHDRLGYKPLTRTNGRCYVYTVDEAMGSIQDQIKSIRGEIMDILTAAKYDLEHPQQSPPESQDPEADVPDFEHEDLDEDPLVAAAAESSDEDQ